MKAANTRLLLRLVVATSLLVGAAQAQACSTVTTWTQLVNGIASNANIVFCPFTISKPASSTITITSSKKISCSQVLKCIIVGGGTHIRVSGPSAQLSLLDGFVFKQANTSALVISGTALTNTIKRCTFANNPTSGYGGAVRTGTGTRLVVRAVTFQSNVAAAGAAIYHRGVRLDVSGSVFNGNNAQGGGVLQLADGASGKIGSSTFSGNSGASMMRAISISLGNLVIESGVTGSSNQGCNGLAASGKCFNFDIIPYRMGELVIQEHGINFSRGLSAKVLATKGQLVQFTSPQATQSYSSRSFHIMPDGAAVLQVNGDGSYTYVSNSEASTAYTAGVYGLTFDANGKPKSYAQLLYNTTRNCNGGVTPWNTWVSCEEVPGGQCWQVDPTGSRVSQVTKLGGPSGGLFEAVAVDNRNPNLPVFYLTEDTTTGAVRQFTPGTGVPGWDLLHATGTMKYLKFLPGNTFEWTLSEAEGRASAQVNYPNVEGVICHDGIVSFVAKTQKAMYSLDLKAATYTIKSTQVMAIPGGGSFDSQPDFLLWSKDGHILFSEDSGSTPGVFVFDGTAFRTLLESYAPQYIDDETTGIDYTPGGRSILFCLQDAGMLFELRRIDGKPFTGGRVLKVKYGLDR